MTSTYCTQPWFEMQIEYNGRTGCCCYYSGQRDDLKWPFDIHETWNGTRLQEIREIVSSGHMKGTGCDRCQSLKYGALTDYTTVTGRISKMQRDNWNRALRNYHEKKVVTDSLPVRYYLNFGLMCNLDCVMCSQSNFRKTDRRNLPVEPLLDLKEYFIRANEIMVIGGEPFSVPDARRFMENISGDPDYESVKLSIVTNGTLLHRNMRLLEKVKRITLWVSLDSIGNAYEHIRKGAGWQQTEKNILDFIETGNRNGLEWNVKIGSVVMKSSIPQMEEFVDWCIEHDTPVHFVPIYPQGFTEAEEVFGHPELLNDIPEWEEIFENSIMKLNKKGWIQNGARPLSFMRDALKARVLIHQGESLFSEGDIRSARDMFAEAELRDSGHVVSYNNLGVAYWEMGELDKSRQYFQKALAMAPEDRDSVLNWGRILISIEQTDEARRLYGSYLQKRPNDEEIAGILACI